MARVEAGKKNMAARAEAAVREMAEGATSVNLYYAGIGDEGTAKVAEELGKNATVEELRLQYNRITDEGVRMLGVSLGTAGAPKLEELQLVGNLASESAVRAVVAAHATR